MKAQLSMFKKGDRVRDVRHNITATVLQDVYDDGDGPGGDGYGVVVEYDDEPGTAVSTGTNHFVEYSEADECPACGREIFADPAGNTHCPCVEDSQST